MGKIAFRLVCVAGCIGLLTPAFATEQVYHPVSPTFGGNPNNGTFLLSTAQAQGEGVNSGNQGPNLQPLADALSKGTTQTTVPTTGSGASVNSAGGANTANPLSTFSGKF